ncbi:unnamed protein product [Hyaloperonospora brassicae]|uniref:Uncharacterized protein n=1 Tax=Hyaloperonospora brassicae TaxID=162125 RepID=A0AAV0TV92_HYABA|nr:unnamed protein product [Hyaloperonospora brassicae]
MSDDLCRELQQLSAAQVRDLLSANGHGNLLRDNERPHNERLTTNAADEQLAVYAKNEGNAFFRQGLMDDAISAYTRCLALDPSNAVCLSNRAAAYLKIERFELAIADCCKAIEVAPTIKSYMRRATAYIALHQFTKAVTDIEAALQFESRNKECYTKLRSIVDTATDASEHAVPVPSDYVLTPRAWHSSVLTDSGRLFVLGGGTYIGPLKDAAMLDLGYFWTKASLLQHR